MTVEASAFLGLERDNGNSSAVFPLFGKWQKCILEQKLFATIRTGEVTSDGPSVSRHSLLAEPKPLPKTHPSSPTTTHLCSSTTHTKQPCKAFLSSESHIHWSHLQQNSVLWYEKGILAQHLDTCLQNLLSLFFFPFFISKKGEVSCYWRRNIREYQGGTVHRDTICAGRVPQPHISEWDWEQSKRTESY